MGNSKGDKGCGNILDLVAVAIRTVRALQSMKSVTQVSISLNYKHPGLN